MACRKLIPSITAVLAFRRPIRVFSGVDVRFRSSSVEASPKKKATLSEVVAPEEIGGASSWKRDLVDHVPVTQQKSKSRGSPNAMPFVDFDNTREVYRSKTTRELIRSLAVFKMCSFDFLVKRNRELMNLSRKLLGKQLFEQLMKMTFYGQFVAGEDQETIKPLIQRNQTFGVGSILDYSVEEDLTQEEAVKKEMTSCLAEAEKVAVGSSTRDKKFKVHQQFGDRRGGVISARTYFYADEAKCDHHMETFLKCIEASGYSSTDGFTAIKLTALGRTQFLLQFSEVLVKWRKFFSHLAADQGKGGLAAMETKLELQKLQDSLVRLGVATKEESENWFTGENLGGSGTVDLLSWNSLIDSRTKISKLLLTPNIQTGQLEPLLSSFTDEEEMQMKRMLQRMDVLAKRAVEKGVRLMVDAEQSYFQPAISRLTLEMQRRFNTKTPIIFNTYQCYLKDAYDNVTVDIELSRREGWYFGAKLVRGAYMDQERSRAAEIGYEDPINATYEATNEMYHRCLDYILEEIHHNKNANVMVASHNESTMKFALKRMFELEIHPQDNNVYFGQLLGMCDQISFSLGQAGYPVYKYVPYGPVEEVLPYLSRRAQENRGMLQGAQRERLLLWRELKRRILSGEVFSTPAVTTI